jgi:hypothetical protein
LFGHSRPPMMWPLPDSLAFLSSQPWPTMLSPCHATFWSWPMHLIFPTLGPWHTPFLPLWMLFPSCPCTKTCLQQHFSYEVFPDSPLWNDLSLLCLVPPNSLQATIACIYL